MRQGRIHGQFATDRYRAEFVVEQDLSGVWAALERIDEATGQPCWLDVWPRFPGESSTGEVERVVEREFIQAHKHSEPCKGSTIALRMESRGKQTALCVEQADLPEWVQHAVDMFVIGGDQIVADLVLYLESGVVLSRHGMPWAFPGFTVTEVGSGLAVAEVLPGTFAARVGLQPADRLVCLGDAPVFNQDGLQALLRILRANTEVSVQWVRAGELMQASAQL